MTSQKIGEIARYIPEYVAERTTYRANDVLNPTGDYILYWMHSAMRLHDNPSLDLCSLLSAQLGKPIIVVQIQATDQPHLNKRHFTFIAEGAKDVAEEAVKNNLCYKFYLLPLEKQLKLLIEYARQATVIVTDDVPINYQRSLATRLQDNTSTPLMRVDSSCIIPLPLLKKKFANKQEFKRETAQLRGERAGRSWHPFFQKPPTLFVPNDISVASVDLENFALETPHYGDDAHFIIPPVTSKKGGSKAGYALWKKAKETILENYPTLNDTPLQNCYAALAPYLRYGMISPFKILFDATLEDTDAAWRFLEYFLIERDYAYTFCYNNPLHDNSLILSDNFRKELKKLEETRTLQSLPRAYERDHMITKDSQWNLLQHTLKTHGMLPEHFFKSYIVTLKNWYPSREKLISFIRENYDKYALDAYDPMCSYSILCALEAIAEPPLGLGEEKPLTLLASPVVLEKIPMLSRPQEKRIAIIGGGIAGLSCAWHLQQRNITATIFEQASHCGGRIITKQEQTMRFDMGAPFFTANHPYFRKFVDYWEKKGHLQQWKGQIYVDNRQAGLNLSKHPFVGLPSMASLVRLLNSEQQTVFRTPITRLEKVQGGWRLFSNAKDCGFFDSVVLAVPSAISYALLGSAPDLQQHIKPCLKFLPIWVIAAGFAQKLPTPYDALAVTQSSFTYAFRESSKPQRSKKEAWVLHAHLQWSQDNLGITEEQASAKIIEAFLSHLKVSTLTATYSAAKLWKRAYVEKPLGKPCLYADGIGICGDWLLGRRIEDAFLSGAHMATELIRTG